MKFLLSYVLSLVSLVNLALSAPLEARSPSCTDFVIPVTISANNVDLPQSLLTHFVDQPLDLLGILLGTVCSISSLSTNTGKLLELTQHNVLLLSRSIAIHYPSLIQEVGLRSSSLWNVQYSGEIL